MLHLTRTNVGRNTYWVLFYNDVLFVSKRAILLLPLFIFTKNTSRIIWTWWRNLLIFIRFKAMTVCKITKSFEITEAFLITLSQQVKFKLSHHNTRKFYNLTVVFLCTSFSSPVCILSSFCIYGLRILSLLNWYLFVYTAAFFRYFQLATH